MTRRLVRLDTSDFYLKFRFCRCIAMLNGINLYIFFSFRSVRYLIWTFFFLQNGTYCTQRWRNQRIFRYTRYIHQSLFFLLLHCVIFLEELDQKIKTLADFIRHAKHFVLYTGAGKRSSFFQKKHSLLK